MNSGETPIFYFLFFAVLGTFSSAHATLPPVCKTTSAALEPYEVVESASVLVALLDSMNAPASHGTSNPFTHPRWQNLLRERAVYLLSFVKERAAQNEDVSPGLIRALERLSENPANFSYRERHELVAEIHSWIAERRQSRVGRSVTLPPTP